MIKKETSVIIRTFNEERHVRGLFDSLREQTYRDFEIILVDSGSVDGTRDIASEYTDQIIRIESRDFTFGYSLNVGIEAAIGEFAVIVSAHTLPVSVNWLDNLIQPLKEPNVAMTFGRQYGCPTSKFSETRDLLRTFGPNRKIHRPPDYFAHNGNSAIRRALWEEHIFDEELTGLEDIEWARYWMDKGYDVIYEPEAGIHHIHEERWSQIQNRYYREALALRRLNLKHRRHIPIEVLKELCLGISDLGRSYVTPGTSDQYTSRNLVGRTKEIVNFRFRKGLGTFKGLLEGSCVGNAEIRDDILFQQTCKSLVVRDAHRAAIEDIPIPQVKPGDVLIRVQYNGICGKDLSLVTGRYINGVGDPEVYPFVPGHEVSGKVSSLGANVTHVKEGDSVVIESMQSCGRCDNCRRGDSIICGDRMELGTKDLRGGCAQYMAVSGQFVHKVPDGLSLEEATLCEPLAIVLKGIERLLTNINNSSDNPCAVIGAGTIGHLCSKVLQYKGYSVTAFDQDSLRLSYLHDEGIQISDDLSHFSKFTTLIDATGDPIVLDRILTDSIAGSSILVLGSPHSYKDIALERIVNYDKCVIGSVGSGPKEFEEALSLLPKLVLDEFLKCVIPIFEFERAFEYFQSRKHLKILLELHAK